jgi:RNA polymerase sigma-54 factor
MRLDVGQHMRLGQQMKLAPRMIQSMEILQMPMAALE